MQLELPIHELADQLRSLWSTHNRLVLIAPTGSGKSTQLCQLLLAAHRVPAEKQIVVLQPRRVAARALARRVADEMGCQLGGLVGYKVRFEESTSDATRIVFVTEGMLLRWLQSDPQLRNVGAILFDEFHERSLHSDLALALCKQLQQLRPELLLMVMSATLDAGSVAGYLGCCPQVQSGGRAFPVTVTYADWDDDAPVWERAAAQVNRVLEEGNRGDVLVFMPGAFEIEQTIREVRRTASRAAGAQAILLLPMHGELSSQEQDRVFQLDSRSRKVIVATNVAETSLTIPGIVYVVDSGLARIAHYDPARGINELRLEAISRASADQRAGRAGRQERGWCHRLWTERSHARRNERSIPEAQRGDLAEAVLLLHSLGVADAVGFDWLDAPSADQIRESDRLLVSLGALVSLGPDSYAVTDLALAMLALPVHPRHARMLIEAKVRGCAPEVSLFVAIISGRDLLQRIDRSDKIRTKARAALNDDPRSDYGLLRRSFELAAACEFDFRVCYANGVNAGAAREVARTWAQLRRLVGDAASRRPADVVEQIARSHLAGNLDRVGARLSSGSDQFEMMDGRIAELRNESALRAQRSLSPLVVASEIRSIQTRDGDALILLGGCSGIKAEWISELRPVGYAEAVEHVYDRLNRRVVAARVMRLGALVIGAESCRDLDPVASGRVLAMEFAHLLAHNEHAPQFPKFTPAVRKTVQARALTEAQLIEILASSWRGCSSAREAAQQDVLLPEVLD